MFQKATRVFGALWVVMAAGQVAHAAGFAVVGQVALNAVRMDGALVPTGTTVLSPSLLETGAYASTVHLATGQSLNLAPNSSAYIQSGPQGLKVTARSGVVALGRVSRAPIRRVPPTVVRPSPPPPTGGPNDGPPVSGPPVSPPVGGGVIADGPPNDTIPSLYCQSPQASVIVPGVPICRT